jgi:hypothetical protein
MTTQDALLDERGRVMFRCALCGEPMTRSDFFDLGLRTPYPGEGADDYCDAELIDSFEHGPCAERRRARAG